MNAQPIVVAQMHINASKSNNIAYLAGAGQSERGGREGVKRAGSATGIFSINHSGWPTDE